MTDTEAFVDFVMQYASDRFTRAEINSFLAVPQSSATLTRWKSLFDGGQQDKILGELGQSEAQQGWVTWGDLIASQQEYENQIAMLKKDLQVYIDARNTDVIGETQKGISDLEQKLVEIEVWKAEHPDTEREN